MDIPNVLEGKFLLPVAIFGGGISGVAVANFLKINKIEYKIYDATSVEKSLTNFTKTSAKKHLLVVYSPGFPKDHPWLKIAQEENIFCVTEAEFATLFWQAAPPILSKTSEESIADFVSRVDNRFSLVAVTGTNGKTTLTEFLSFAFRRIGKNSVALGNNGIPMMNMLMQSSTGRLYPICEISSFQAETMRYFSPRAILWTNFDEDHLDRHKTMEAYFRAKLNLVECLKSIPLILENIPANTPEREVLLNKRCLIIGESVANAAKEFSIELPAWTHIVRREDVKDIVPEKSIFNSYPQLENYAIARKFWELQGYDLKLLDEAALLFTPKKYRLAYVDSIEKGIKIEFWNDSKGTNFHAVYAALKSFENKKIFWVGGGRAKGGDLAIFAKNVAAKVENAYLIGETGAVLAENMKSLCKKAQKYNRMQEAVFAAYQDALKQKDDVVVLFSPGFASFDMYKSYFERGARFEQIVREVKNVSTE